MKVLIEVETWKPSLIDKETDVVIVWDLESTKRIDHDNSSDRKWLGSHCFWAMRNGRRVVTQPINPNA